MKYIQITIFIIIYISLGFLLKLDGNQYLLIGIPLSLIFQVFVRKKSIKSAWLRTDEKFDFNYKSILYIILFCIYPCYQIFKMCTNGPYIITRILYNLCIILGSFGFSYAVSNLTKKTAKETLLCLLTSGILGVLISFGGAFVKSYLNSTVINFNFESFFTSILTYVPIVFVLEEVIFRGILDEHISENDKEINYWSILYICFLWGWWHLPISNKSFEEIVGASVIFPIIHTIVGFFMSVYWRKSGNLIVPGFTHAFIDAIRNALLK